MSAIPCIITQVIYWLFPITKAVTIKLLFVKIAIPVI